MEKITKIFKSISEELNLIISIFDRSYPKRKKYLRINKWKWNKFPNWGDTNISIDSMLKEYYSIEYSISKILLSLNIYWILLNYIKVLNGIYLNPLEKIHFDSCEIEIEFSNNGNWIDNFIRKNKNNLTFNDKKISFAKLRSFLVHPLGEGSNKEIKNDGVFFSFRNKNLNIRGVRCNRKSQEYFSIDETDFEKVFISEMSNLLNLIKKFKR